MLLSFCAVVGGLVALVYAADRFIIGAAALAKLLGVPALIIGLTVVGIGTSLPEIVVAIIASIQDKASLAIGNAIGSNITNIALVLGLSAMVAPLAVNTALVRRELPALIAVSLLALILAWDGQFSVADGIILLIGLAATLGAIAYFAKNSPDSDPITAEIEADVGENVSHSAAMGWLLVGLVLLPLSSQSLVWGASNIATALGVSDLVIGLTIVAIGTSLPELATALSAIKKGEHDLVLGNIVGSNLFNILAVLAFPALLAPGFIPDGLLVRDLPLMLALTGVLYFMCWGRTPRISRFQGAMLFAVFLGYEALLYASRFQ